MVFAFGQRQSQVQLADRLARRGTNRFRIVFQHHTGQQLFHLGTGQRMLDRDFVDLGHMVLGRTHAVDEMAVVRQEQQAGRVLIESANRLNALHCPLVRPQPERTGQQRVDAGPHRRLLRTLGTCGLVQHQVRFFVVLPLRALDRKTQPGRCLFTGRIDYDHAVHCHKALLDQPCAHAPRTETLVVKNVLKLHH